MNWWRFYLGVAACVHENIYFGWNLLPKSDAELIADTLVFLIFALAIRDKKT